MIAHASVDIVRYKPNIRRISRPQNNNDVITPIFAVDPVIKHGCIAEQSRYIFRQQRVCRCIGDVLLNFAEYAPTDRRMIDDYRKISSSKEAKLLNCSTGCCSLNMDLSNVSSTSRDIPRKLNVQTGKLNYLYNSRHHLEYLHVFGDVRAMK